MCVCVCVWGGGGVESSEKITASREGGHVKKIGKLRDVVQFLNGDSRIPVAPPPS